MFDDFDTPTIWVNYLKYLETKGYVAEIVGGFWEIRATNPQTHDVIHVKPTSSLPVKRDLLNLQVWEEGTRVLILEEVDSSLDMLDMWVAAAEGEGIGILARKLGWVNRPHELGPVAYRELAPLLHPDYSRRNDGSFEKVCRECGEVKPVGEFYRKPSTRRNYVDPYRTTCKECFRGGLDKGG